MALSIEEIIDNHMTPTVMIVDDQSVNRMVLGETLKSIDPSIRIELYQNASDALAAAVSSTPNLIISDYRMPNMDGIEFARQIRNLPNCADVPIIMITIIDDKSVLYDALENGITDFLSKPFDQFECKARCKNLLALGKHQSRLRLKSNLLQQKVDETTEEILIRERETLNRLTKACEYKDCVTGGHLIRMSKISHVIALELGLDKHFAKVLEIASPLHDIGKIAISDDILMKKGKLNKEEFEIMKTHTNIGYDILKDSPSPYLQTGAMIALNHHEKYDGSGYPNRIKGDEIPIEARIVSVADVFDALTNHRPYKKAWPLDETLNFIKTEKGKHLDPDCVDALISKTNEIYPSNIN